jgi:hypothetical protein
MKGGEEDDEMGKLEDMKSSSRELAIESDEGKE